MKLAVQHFHRTVSKSAMLAKLSSYSLLANLASYITTVKNMATCHVSVYIFATTLQAKTGL